MACSSEGSNFFNFANFHAKSQRIVKLAIGHPLIMDIVNPPYDGTGKPSYRSSNISYRFTNPDNVGNSADPPTHC